MNCRPILLVEDNPDDEFLALRALRRQGFDNVVVAHDGEEALKILFDAAFQRPVPAPWFVLLDLKLPKVSGLELLEAIRKSAAARELPVIVASSSRESRDVATCQELGILAYLTKPIDGGEIVRILGQAGLIGADGG